MSNEAAVVVVFDLGDTLVAANNHWVSGAPQVLQKLKARGVRLGIISNTGTLNREELAVQLPADFSFNEFEPTLVLLSAEVGIEKPDLRIFTLAVERAGSGATAIFCTEDLVHSVAAQRGGLLALRVVPPPASDVADLVEALARTIHEPRHDGVVE